MNKNAVLLVWFPPPEENMPSEADCSHWSRLRLSDLTSDSHHEFIQPPLHILLFILTSDCDSCFTSSLFAQMKSSDLNSVLKKRCAGYV